MSQAPSVIAPPPFSPDQPLKPALQAALASLDIQLEEELARYRRQRGGRPVMAGKPRTQTRKGIDLISLAPGENKNQSSLATATKEDIARMIAASSAANGHTANTETATAQQTSQDATASAETSKTLFPAAGVSATLPITTPAEQQSENTANGSHASKIGASQTRSARLGGDLVYQGSIPDPPDDYLASSEELLRSLAEEEEQSPRERTIKDNLLTPLGVGSILLLLLSSATLGYIAMKPSTLGYLGFNRQTKTPTVVQNTTPTPTKSENTGSLPPVINGPNLADREFVDLNLNNLSTIKTNSQGPGTAVQLASHKPILVTPYAPPSSVGSGSTQDLAKALLPPEIQPIPALPTVVGPPPAKPTTQTPAAAPKPAASAQKTPSASASTAKVVANSAQLRKGLYYVLVNYDSDRTLAKVRQIVPDAYVIQFPKGARIQIAAFYTASEAQALSQDLQKKGISASAYQP